MTYIIFSQEVSGNYYIPEDDDFKSCIFEYEEYMTGNNSTIFSKAIQNMTEAETVELFNLMYPDCKIDEIYELGRKIV